MNLKHALNCPFVDILILFLSTRLDEIDCSAVDSQRTLAHENALPQHFMGWILIGTCSQH